MQKQAHQQYEIYYRKYQRWFAEKFQKQVLEKFLDY